MPRWLGGDRQTLLGRVVGRVGRFPAFGPIEAEDPDEPVLGLDDPRTEDGEAEASAEWRDLLSPLVEPGLHGAGLHGVDPELRGHSDYIDSASPICIVSPMPAGMPGRTVGTMHALVVTYGLRGMSAVEHAELGEQLAPAFAAVPGLLSRTGLENAALGRYGALYLFESEAALQGFVASELYGLSHENPGLAALAASEFSVTNGGTSKT
jgi:hypothetical protein